MTTSIVECPHCHYRFNYEFIPSASFYSIRLGTKRIFTCPHCRELHNFAVTHFGTDPSLPTHGDNAETGIGAKIWASMLVPLVTLIVVGFLLLFFFSFVILFIIALTIGVAWTFVYTLYLYKKISRNEKQEAKLDVC